MSISCTNTSMSPESFCKAVSILIDKPHVVNKRLWGAKTLLRIQCSPTVAEWNFPANCAPLANTNPKEFKEHLLQETKLQENLSDTGICLIVIELLPKTYSENHAFQLVIFRTDKAAVKFYDVTPEHVTQKLCPSFPYSLQLDGTNVTLGASCDDSSNSYKWLKTTVLPQFVKWAEGSVNKISSNVCKESLILVSKDKYYTKYNELKLKYGKEMVKVWPECTDPTKFVYEDVAIAAYILLLWEEEKLSEQTFVDLGCGNGLLVYILTKEGHCGVGIDVRRRQIWDMYSDDIQLEERTITPSDSHLFPKTDWIIGNHSDELTPWIPVIAARSSYNCNFFLLPCCAYNFDGTKYQRQNSSISQYTEYLQYIKELTEKCGFKSDMDRLKIPSTKRICIVSRGRIYPEEEHDKYCDNIQNIINNEIQIENKEMNSEQNWIQGFKAREPVERVRNCTQIDKKIIEVIVNIISAHLLKDCNLDSDWSAGDPLDISEVVALVSQEKLKALKSECGGLQTLLKNNHHIFKVQSGKVQLRYPKTIDEVRSSSKKGKNNKGEMKIQQRPCWFYGNHPQGCPLQDNVCSFLHVNI